MVARTFIAAAMCGCIAIPCVSFCGETAKLSASRTFRFDYGATVSELPKDSEVRIWLPAPGSSRHQRVKLLDQELPGDTNINIDSAYGNKILYIEAKPAASGKISFNLGYKIVRDEVRGASGGRIDKLTEKERKLFLAANARIPLNGKPAELISKTDLPTKPLDIGRRLYLQVDEHMKYDKSKPGYGFGDAAWACDSRFGNCTDFHSLFISWARIKGIPARFEIGFPIPEERGTGTIGGYHCWAYFYVDGEGWYPVDISEADKHPEKKEYYFGNLTENRVTFSVGRDIDLVPKQAGEPLNYFVYPYVEVDGMKWPKEKINLKFAYTDL